MRVKMSGKIIRARLKPDGTVVRVQDDGTETPVVIARLPAMSEEEIMAAALSDPDCQPLTEERLATLKRVPRSKTMRRVLGLTQEEFAARYHIALGTLRDWEQGRSEPDQTAKSYLRVIRADPEGIARMLAKKAEAA
jgi:putative transcriptional regulator